MSTSTPLPDVTLHSPALPNQEALFIVKMEGREAISTLYRFEILFQVDQDNGLDEATLDDLIGAPAYIALDSAGETKIHGMLVEVEQLPYADLKPVLYRAVLVPRMWRLTQRVGSWVYQELTLAEIFSGILKEAGFDKDDFEIALTGSPAPDYVVQYQESDFQFMSRWMESLGIFYYFVQTADCEKLVITDQNARARDLPHAATLDYDPNPAPATLDACVLAISRLRRPIPKTFKLRDYNWATPTVSVAGQVELDVAGALPDTVSQFGAVIDSVPIQTLAQRRAEEAQCARETFECRSHVRGVAPGSTFALANHPSDVFEDRHLITSVEHTVVQLPPLLASSPPHAPRTGFAQLPATPVPYNNRFTTQRASVPFRPARVTPRPRIHGTTLGRIDGTTTVGMHAPTDVFGRYKVVMFYDQAPDTGGKASCWIRVAQRTAGPAYGDHARLQVGTEVLISYLDGDPDRPVIVGALPNALNTSPVVMDNATQDVVRTRAGSEIVFEDDSGNPHQGNVPTGTPAHTTS